MSENVELKAMLDYLNYYSRFRGRFREELNGIKYSQDMYMGLDICVSEEAIKKLYASELRASQLAEDSATESDLRLAWVQEHIENPLREKHLSAVAEGRKVDSERKGGNDGEV
jgi:hypothetical protein